MYKIFETEEYKDWVSRLNIKEQGQIESRLAMIRQYGYFGQIKKLSSKLIELKWRCGRRVYFTKQGDRIVLLLVGGNKRTQKRDIKRALRLIERVGNSYDKV